MGIIVLLPAGFFFVAIIIAIISLGTTKRSEPVPLAYPKPSPMVLRSHQKLT